MSRRCIGRGCGSKKVMATGGVGPVGEAGGSSAGGETGHGSWRGERG